jgi:hypothetical protein
MGREPDVNVGGIAAMLRAGFALDLRLLKFSVRAEALPGRPGGPLNSRQAPPKAAAAEALPGRPAHVVPGSPDTTPPRSGRRWLVSAVGLLLVLLGAATAVWWFRRSHAKQWTD